jgi:hypothetical protein
MGSRAIPVLIANSIRYYYLHFAPQMDSWVHCLLVKPAR